MDKYLLYTTAEECNEVAQGIMKVLRFGLDTNYTGESNKKKLETEIGQLLFCIEKMSYSLQLDGNVVADAFYNKQETWDKWKAYHNEN